MPISNTRFLRALHRDNVGGPPPVWFMRQAGRYQKGYQALRSRYSFAELCAVPELIVATTLLPVAQFDVDAAILFSDILLLLEPLGFKVTYEEPGGPRVIGEIEKMRYEAGEVISALQPTLDAICELEKRLTIPLIAFAGAPFTLAAYALEGGSSHRLPTTQKWLYSRREALQSIINLLTDAIIELLQAQVAAGASVVQLFESWGNELTWEAFQRYSVEPMRRIVTALHPTPVIYFAKGSSSFYPLMRSSGCAALSLDWHCCAREVRKGVGRDMALQGNLDPHLFLHGTVEEVVAATKQLCLSMEGDPAYIFNLGHGILPQTPEANVAACIAAIRR